MYVTRIFIVLCALVNASSTAESDENKFTYTRKLLDKVIRMEIRMEQMEAEVKNTRENVQSFIQNYTGAIENKTEELQLIGERIDVPLIAFSAHNPVDRSPDTNQIIIWQNTRLNAGDGYDTVIGIFTAPVSGLYYFAVHMCNYTGQTVIYGIVLEQNIIASSYKYDQDNNDCGSMNAVTMVNKGQRVWVKCTSGSTSAQIWESHGTSSFVGVLLHKEIKNEL